MLKKRTLNSNLARLIFDKEILYKEPHAKQPVVEKQPTKVVEKPQPSKEPIQVLPVIEPVKVTEVKPSSYDFKQKVLILTTAISVEEKQLLEKIIGAVGLKLDQVDLVEYNKYRNIDYQEVISKKVTSKFISFGVGFSKLGWSLLLVPYQIKSIDGVEFLLADSLQNIAINQNLKKSLWLSLQKMFGV